MPFLCYVKKTVNIIEGIVFAYVKYNSEASRKRELCFATRLCNRIPEGVEDFETSNQLYFKKRKPNFNATKA